MHSELSNHFFGGGSYTHSFLQTISIQAFIGTFNIGGRSEGKCFRGPEKHRIPTPTVIGNARNPSNRHKQGKESKKEMMSPGCSVSILFCTFFGDLDWGLRKMKTRYDDNAPKSQLAPKTSE